MDNRENCLLPIRCEHLKYTGEHTVHYRNKVVKPYTYYCIAEKRVRTVGTRFDWVGKSPEDCPMRKEVANGSEVERVRDGRADPRNESNADEA